MLFDNQILFLFLYEIQLILYMKKTICIFCLLLIFLCGCSRKASHYRIGVSQCSDDEWRTQMNKELIRESFFYEKIKLDIRSVRDDSYQQIRDIRYFIDNDFDLIIVSPNEAGPLTPIIEEAYHKNIPVILVDRNIFSDKFTAFVWADNFEIGKSVGNYIVSQLEERGKMVEISGLIGSTPARDRHHGMKSVVSKYPGIEVLAEEDAGWITSSAKNIMGDLLVKYPDIDLVYAHNDRMAAGAFEAAKEAGREKDIIFVGIDAIPGEGFGVDQVLKGTLNATFIYPTGGDRVFQLAMNILQGKPYERENILKTTIVNETNARIMNMQVEVIEELDDKIELLNSRIGTYMEKSQAQTIILYTSFTILALLIVIILLVYNAYRIKNRSNTELEKQRDQLIKLSCQLEETTHAKLAFFTNISHDFRTPLTLIADPINQLLKDKQLPDISRQLLQMVQRNVNILLRLVNQILDFRKYENGKLDLVLKKCDLNAQLQDWVNAFTALASKKNIELIVEIQSNCDFNATVDLTKMERACFNLLSNAFKFTPDNGKIKVSLSILNENGSEFIKLAVEDNGIGISPQHIKHIFDRFYTIDYQYAGSGIGLALTKAFVELHGGRLEVESEEDKGSSFAIIIPKMQPEFLTAESMDLKHCLYKEQVTEIEESSSAILHTEIQPKIGADLDYKSESLLIIDDNSDIRNYIRSFMGENYTLLEADNGKVGLEMAKCYVPDIIICDVMMPVMDGHECCKALKEEMKTCHIPVIMLTACTLDEQRIVGFETGADSYISKPFNSMVLKVRVQNLIQNRIRLKHFFGDHITLSKESISSLDKEFVERFRKLLQENISDSSFNVEEMGKQMGMSRVQLYRKTKSLTNYAPNELMRITRLKKAADLLSSSGLSITEIAYEVGFTSPSYFAKCYKEYFGESPTNSLKKG